MKVFSIIPVNGTINKNHAKYKKVENCPISKNGLSGCWLPIQIKTPKFAENTQNINLIIGLNWLPLTLEVSNNGIANKINREANIATTPNNLFGIDLKIA
jgi:hypothetical protein